MLLAKPQVPHLLNGTLVSVTTPASWGCWVDQNKNEIMNLNVTLTSRVVSVSVMMVAMMSQSRRSWHCAFEAVAGHLLMFMDLQSLRVGVVLMSDTPFHCHTTYFRSKLCPCLFEKKNTLCAQSLEMRHLGLPALNQVPWTSLQNVYAVLKCIVFGLYCWSLNFSWH